MDIKTIEQMTDIELYDVIKQAERDQRGALDLAQQDGQELGGSKWGTFWGAHYAYQQLHQILFMRLVNKRINIREWMAEMEMYDHDIQAGKITRIERDMAMIL